MFFFNSSNLICIGYVSEGVSNYLRDLNENASINRQAIAIAEVTTNTFKNIHRTWLILNSIECKFFSFFTFKTLKAMWLAPTTFSECFNFIYELTTIRYEKREALDYFNTKKWKRANDSLGKSSRWNKHLMKYIKRISRRESEIKSDDMLWTILFV